MIVTRLWSESGMILDNISIIAAGALALFLAGWLLILGLRSSRRGEDTTTAFRRPARVRMYEAAQGRIDRLREKTFAELEQMPPREVALRLSRRKRKFKITTTKRRLENGSLEFSITARERSWLTPWIKSTLVEVFPPDHQPRKPLAPVAETAA
jgi:hypothetical protein